MPESFDAFSQSFRLADALDIGVATALFAATLLWIRNRSAYAFLLAVIAGAALYLLSDWLRMYLTLAMFRWGMSLVLFSLVVIFQKDIRHGWERLAAWRPFSQSGPPQGTLTDTLVETATLLVNERIGALIVLPGRQKLARHLRGGVPLEGQVSVPLLHSLFHADSQGHDGAVVLRGNQVSQFGVHLPLSENFDALRTGGTRHAAALGLAEQSDALAIVVSEERAVISLAHRGQLHELHSSHDLADYVEQFQSGQLNAKSGWQRLKWLAETSFAVLLSFALAGFFWLLVAHDVESVQRVVDQIPIEIQNVPEGWVVESIHPEHVRVNISGSERAFKAFNWTELKADLNLANATDGRQTISFGENALSLPEEMSVVSIMPNLIRVNAYKTQTVELPIQIKTQGQLPKGYKLDEVRPSLKSVPVKVRASQAAAPKAIPTEPINLNQLDSSTTREIQLDFPPGAWPAPETPKSLQVTIGISPTSE